MKQNIKYNIQKISYNLIIKIISKIKIVFVKLYKLINYYKKINETKYQI